MESDDENASLIVNASWPWGVQRQTSRKALDDSEVQRIHEIAQETVLMRRYMCWRARGDDYQSNLTRTEMAWCAQQYELLYSE